MNLGKIINFWSEEKISVLSVGHEDNHEHELESYHIWSTSGQGGIQLVHGPVEGDVLEQFEPGTEHIDSQDVGGSLLPETQGVKVSKCLRFSKERLEIN